MLIHPWDAPQDDSEWRHWLAVRDFGQLAVNGLPGDPPWVQPLHFAYDAERGEAVTHLARPNPLCAALEADPQVVETAGRTAAALGGSVELISAPEAAVTGADAVYTDTWTSMGAEAEADLRRLRFAGFRVDAALLAHAPEALVMHCLPAHRGEEITDEVLDGPRSVVLDQAENRLYVQQAVLVELLTGGG